MIFPGGVSLRGQNCNTKHGIHSKIPPSTTCLKCRAQINTGSLEISSPNGGTYFGSENIFGDRSFLTLIQSLHFIAEENETRLSQGHSLADKAET